MGRKRDAGDDEQVGAEGDETAVISPQRHEPDGDIPGHQAETGNRNGTEYTAPEVLIEQFGVADDHDDTEYQHLDRRHDRLGQRQPLQAVAARPGQAVSQKNVERNGEYRDIQRRLGIFLGIKPAGNDGVHGAEQYGDRQKAEDQGDIVAIAAEDKPGQVTAAEEAYHHHRQRDPDDEP